MGIQVTLFLLYFAILIYCYKQPKKFEQYKAPSKYDNPNFIRDRLKEFVKPFWNESWQNRFDKPFHPAWMDYCDPYHCNDYHKPACGLNRKKMRFKWFQSGCHIILNNQCANYRGSLKYDIIAAKFCVQYAIFLRSGCPSTCDIEKLEPVCGISTIDNHLVLFRSGCALQAANCRRGSVEEYEEVSMALCTYYI